MQFWIEITFMYRLDVCFTFEFFMIGSSYWSASAPKKNYHIRKVIVTDSGTRKLRFKLIWAFEIDLERTRKYRTSNFPNFEKTVPRTFRTLKLYLEPPKKYQTSNQPKKFYFINS